MKHTKSTLQNNTWKSYQVPFSILLTLSLFVILIGLMCQRDVMQLVNMDLALTIDLLLVIPLVYFLSIRTTSIPNTTVTPVVILGLTLGTYFLAEEHQYYLNLFKTWGLPILELTVVTWIVVKLVQTQKKYDQLKKDLEDFFITLKKVCLELLPERVALLLASEIAVFYYAFFNWHKKKLQSYEFTYHKGTGSIALIAVLIFIIGIETFVLHLLLAMWSPIVAWVLTGLSCYSMIQCWGILKSILKRPIILANGKLYLRYGIAKETILHLKDIASVELSSKQPEEAAQQLTFLGGLEGFNVVLRLKKEATLYGLYGIKRQFKTLLLQIDNKDQFIQQLQAGMTDPSLTTISTKANIFNT